MSIVVSAPGKIHLLGEHSVVYGKPAILSAVSFRLYTELIEDETKKAEISVLETYDDKLVKATVEIFKKTFKINRLHSLKIKISSQIPVGSGLGSSAALSAALLGVLFLKIKNLWNPVKINELSYEVEKIAHGNPSGADNTAVVFGGLVYFRREFDFLKSIWSLPIKIYKIPKFLLIDSGRPAETTKEMVSKVRKHYKRNSIYMEKIFNDQEKQTKELLLSLRVGDWKKLQKTIYFGERNLEKMGIVGNGAKKIIRTIEKKGGFAKVCGAGGFKKGSGYILAYHDNLSILRSLIRDLKLSYFPAGLGAEGIRIEKNEKN